PAMLGHTIAFTAVVSTGRPDAATGFVTFSDGANVLGTIALVNGTATLSTDALSAGDHSIIATYSVDGNNLSSASEALNETVSRLGTGTTLTADMSAATAGQMVTLTAMVSNGMSEVATGFVTFSDGANLLGTAPLVHGTATMSITTLAVGSHSITAGY